MFNSCNIKSPPPSIVVINRRGAIYINSWAERSDVRTRLCQNVDLSSIIKDDRRSWFFGSCGTVSGDGQNSGCSTLGNDGRVWERVSVMGVHTICDEKRAEALRD